MATYFSLDGAELREVAGEMNSIVATGTLSIKEVGRGVTFAVGDYTWQLPKNDGFKIIDIRTVKFDTNDIMTTLYLSLPKSADAAQLELFKTVLTAVGEGKDSKGVTAAVAALNKAAAKAAPAPAPAAPAPAPAPASAVVAAAAPSEASAAPAAAGEQKKNQFGQFMDLMGAVGNAAAQVGNELMKKAKEDTQLLVDKVQQATQQQQQGKPT
eukprot:CAMPEP_0202890494 /NCGR_PEP_ID=MMETSP1392-20130828/874_1 /ASSEMBLY_ACC=CAM_ASM_000868 /TAXON_ID=225041 /ORGANISM="Chlamydomonas chlamydogama, Strain SAG 11-48b" /LENGTH=211 /DNA_ID=CAMNT_0049574071 /DNA_START=46 /DNA_END=681 /DNA_ORIENTATION=+